MSQPQARFEDLVEFPSVFEFRALAHSADGVEARCVSAVEAHLGRRVETVGQASSSKGAYTSVRISVLVTSADEIRSTYAMLGALPGVRMVL
jgi:putative lipoic acid-binding regulatory protein